MKRQKNLPPRKYSLMCWHISVSNVLIFLVSKRKIRWWSTTVHQTYYDLCYIKYFLTQFRFVSLWKFLFFLIFFVTLSSMWSQQKQNGSNGKQKINLIFHKKQQVLKNRNEIIRKQTLRQLSYHIVKKELNKEKNKHKRNEQKSIKNR